MGLISKIEDKISGNKSSDSQYEQSSSSGNASHLQHPVSSGTSGPTGTAVPNSSSTSGATSGVGRDGYGTTQSSGYGNQTSDYKSQHSQPGGYSTTSRSEAPGGYSSSDPRTTTTTNTTNQTSSSGPREPYDPYSSKGQRTAADAAHQHGMTPTTGGSRAPYEDANVSRSHQGGVLNSSTGQQGYPSSGQQGYSSSGQPGHSSGYVDSAPHASSGQHDLSSRSDDRHHYGRDAAATGGVGAAGVGAYELGKHHEGTSSQNYSRPQEGNMPYREGGEQSMHRSGEESRLGGAAAPGTTGGMSSSGGGLDHAKKMGGAYEAGYRDGMEHMRQEMENQRLTR